MIETLTLTADRPATDINVLVDGIYSAGLLEVARMVRHHNGSVDDARDIFHDAMMVLIRQVESGKQIDAPMNYLIGTARHIMYRKLRLESKTYDLDQIEESTPEDAAPPQVNLMKVLAVVQKTGKSCLDFLTAIFIEKKDLPFVTNQFGLKSEHVASVKKYKCLEQVRNIVKKNSLEYEDFTD